MKTPRLNLPLIVEGQVSPQLTHNEAMLLAEIALTGVASRTTTAEPPTPTDGDAYVLPEGKTGAAWDGFVVGSIAARVNGGWLEITGYAGLTLYVIEEATTIVYRAGGWHVGGGGGAVPNADALINGIPISDGAAYALKTLSAMLFAPVSGGAAAPPGWRLHITGQVAVDSCSLSQIEFREVAGVAQIGDAVTAFASSFYDANYAPANAFDGVLGKGFGKEWNSAFEAGPYDLGTRYPGGRRVVQVAIHVGHASQAPTTFTVQSSLDTTNGLDGAWVDEDSFTLTGPVDETWFTFDLSPVSTPNPGLLPDPGAATDDTLMIVETGRYEAIALTAFKAKLDALP